MADVYFTWFGPPASANKTVSGIDGKVRPDIFGALRTAKARFKNNPPPTIKFCCLREYKSQFKGALPSYVDIVPIEDQFSSSGFTSVSLSKPNLDDLGTSVDFIIRETIKWRGSRGLPFKKLAFMKDLWSLYVLWHFGGYHLDCGCFPSDKKGGVLDLPDPTTFGVAAFTEEGDTTFYHKKVKFPGMKDRFCAAIKQGNQVLTQMVINPIAANSSRPCYLTKNIDVWLMRSPAGDKAARIALEFYILGWFAIRAANLPEALEPDAYRELVVSAVATGVTHSHSKGKGCFDRNHYKTHLITSSSNPPYVPSLNLRKVGFQSHRD